MYHYLFFKILGIDSEFCMVESFGEFFLCFWNSIKDGNYFYIISVTGIVGKYYIVQILA